MVTCWPAAQLDATKRLYSDLHQTQPFHDGQGNWAKEFSRDFPFHYSDGVSFFMSPTDLNLGGDFLSEVQSVEDVAQEPENRQRDQQYDQ